ncbi:hypothetical protein CHLRE_16g683150v5 [Chlamydomonas reinhardtii]|uniref:Uncharacterized protein n=1 Tax=Chlamydomonas reinhardtii TaxID=3055 RepID=A8IS53_CHLRE|nr:uncharacterized protein CHLRE_16g683150v5 [Chlamydomonas reinhardtii]PNW72082.1 hypothetical protein CHLRE_16g683150v5 [Chlamydomonas reinhardtii]|eukprot:XP_001692071.1 predicted protein [Chlamydomonas reinhardtii]
MQRASLSLLKNCVGGASLLETSLQRALASSYTTLSSSTGSSSSSLPTPAVRPGLLSSLSSSGPCGVKGIRFAGDYKPEVPGNTVDNWTELRASWNKERASSLGTNYYLNVAVMGFAYWLNEAYYFPPRTLYVGALVFFALYVRKAYFSTPYAFKHEY